MSSLIEDSQILISTSAFNLLRFQHLVWPLEISSICSCKNESKKGKFLFYEDSFALWALLWATLRTAALEG